MLVSAQAREAVPFEAPARRRVDPLLSQFDRPPGDSSVFQTLFDFDGRYVLDAADNSPDIQTKPRMKPRPIGTGHLRLEDLELLRINHVEHLLGDQTFHSTRRRHKS